MRAMTDTANRDSLACDIMEPIRVKCDAFVLDWLQHERLRRSDFWEDRDGNCRLASSLAIKARPAGGYPSDKWYGIPQKSFCRCAERSRGRAGVFRYGSFHDHGSLRIVMCYTLDAVELFGSSVDLVLQVDGRVT